MSQWYCIVYKNGELNPYQFESKYFITKLERKLNRIKSRKNLFYYNVMVLLIYKYKVQFKIGEKPIFFCINEEW